MRIVMTAVVAILVSILNPVVLCAGQYAFTKVADVDRQAVGVNTPTPSINDEGIIAFYGKSDTLPLGLYVGDASGITPIATISAGFVFGGVPVINNSGQVAFQKTALFQGGLYRGTTTGVTPIIEMPYASNAYGSNGPSLADNGTVAFQSEKQLGGFLDPQEKYIYTSSGAGLTLVDSLGEVSPKHFDAIESTSSSASGVLAYSWQSDDFSQRQIVRIQDGGQTVITSVSELGGGLGAFAVNDNGLVAFNAVFDVLDPSTAGIYLADGDSITTLASGSLLGPYRAFDGGVSLNNPGEVAFYASHKPDIQAGTLFSGIFTGPNPLSDKVIQTGDLLDGLAVTKILFGNEGLSDSGQIAFYAEFSDGHAAEYIATPVVVPEPFSVALMGTGAACLSVYSFLRRNCATRS